MYPLLLFRDTFAEDANLVVHTPTPSGGPAWEYDDVAGAYTCHVYGALDGANAASTAPARNLYSIPTSVTKWRMQVDFYRGGVDFVGGGFLIYALVAPGAIASWEPKNCIAFGIARRDANSVQFSVQYNRPDIPAGPALVALRSANITHSPSAGKRYILEVDEVAGSVALFVADVVTGSNELPVASASPDPVDGDGLFTAELTAHVANDTTERLIGLEGGWAATGVTYFAAADLRVYELEVLPTGRHCKCLLQVFDDDRTTVLWEVSTDELHARPYLVEPSHYGEREIDVATGSASLGSVEWTVIDLAQLLGDQDSGYLSALLAQIGVPSVAGRRFRMIRFDLNGNAVIIVDGPSGAPRLNPDYASFSGDIRDFGETERKARLFDLVVGSSAAAPVGTAPTSVTSPGTGYDFDWDVVVSP